MDKTKIFISHRSIDKEIADLIQDFLIALGVNRNMIFCSSLPGSDVKEKISKEIKIALASSCLNIVILSSDYYDSAYCLNEAGVLWFLDTPVIPIVMPEINEQNMIGFLGNEYKIRKLDNDVDLAYINDCLCDVGILKSSKAIILNYETKKAIDKYQNIIQNRKKDAKNLKIKTKCNSKTDDEVAVLYYCASRKLRIIKKKDFTNWLFENEIYGINADNAFDLISASNIGIVDNDILTIDIDVFRELMTYNEMDLAEYQTIVDFHTNYGEISFMSFWDDNKFDDNSLLFISYIIDEREFRFGYRWKEEAQVKSIKEWESKNHLSSLLSRNYKECLILFINNKWVYPSDYTSKGNPREYKLHNSIKRLLIEDSTVFLSKLNAFREKYTKESYF